jgi:hypothetical protein
VRVNWDLFLLDGRETVPPELMRPPHQGHVIWERTSSSFSPSASTWWSTP